MLLCLLQVLPPVDHTFNYCQRCGYVRRRGNPPKRKALSLDLPAIDNRIQVLQQRNLSSAYSKQKQSLKEELENFLYALPGRKTLFDAIPFDVCRFLVYKDAMGKTQPHSNGCPYTGQRGVFSCHCPRCLSYNTVDSYIGKLRSIFSDAGRQGDWKRSLHLGNPASDEHVTLYLKQVTAEQLQAHVTPKQATPIFPDKLLLLSRHLEKRLLLPNLSPSEMSVAARDQAFFKCLFYSGDRAGDLDLVKTPEIARFPEDSGLLFNHVWGKTLRDGSSNLFGMRRHPNPALCPIRAVEMYVAVSREIGIDLSRGYLFRPTDQKGRIVDQPLTSSMAESRLKLYLRQANIDADETLHSFRSGCALTLTFSGSNLTDVMSHVGWSSPSTAQYYLKLSSVIRAGAPADLLSKEYSQSGHVSALYEEFNNLKFYFRVSFSTVTYG